MVSSPSNRLTFTVSHAPRAVSAGRNEGAASKAVTLQAWAHRGEQAASMSQQPWSCRGVGESAYADSWPWTGVTRPIEGRLASKAIASSKRRARAAAFRVVMPIP